MHGIAGRITGRCLCGGVSYEADAAQMTALCHCRDCQRQTGSSFSAIATVPAGSLCVEGTLASHETTGASGGKVERFFCPTCGSPIYSAVDNTPGLVWLKTGTIDGETPRPQLQLWASASQPWVTEIGAIEPQFAANPPSA